MSEQRTGIPAGFILDTIRKPKDTVDTWGAELTEDDLASFLGKRLLSGEMPLENKITIIGKVVKALRAAGFSHEQIQEIIAEPEVLEHQEIIRAAVKGSSISLEKMVQLRIDSYAAKVEEVIQSTLEIEREISIGKRKPEEAVVVKNFQITLLPFKDDEGEGVRWVLAHFNEPFNKTLN
jgi:DNA-binding transcriptional MerR regulator